MILLREGHSCESPSRSHLKTDPHHERHPTMAQPAEIECRLCDGSSGFGGSMFSTRGVNSEGNTFCRHIFAGWINAYFYWNANGSFYCKNPDRSAWYQDPEGGIHEQAAPEAISDPVEEAVAQENGDGQM
ncbi:hypothetical protein OF83DRAFT_1288238 [Amylostereum chailletii]|nr:hypothetical protein OF83DRAFT_1288238 [Amylostereum chailletii]